MENTLRTIFGDGFIQGSQGNGGKASKKQNTGVSNEEGSHFEESEIAVILEFVEDNYKALYGHGSGTEIKAKRDKMWKLFVEAVNKVYK